MAESAKRKTAIALGVLGLLLAGGCTHYADIKGDNPKAKAWAESEHKREEEERARTRAAQARDPAATPDEDRAVLPPAPPPPRGNSAPPSR